jgi:photosystem II stability/assembly factor-like uncharacterized protein
MPAPPPTASSAPAGESRWQCDPGGGLACYDDLIQVTMLSPDEGWATGSKGVILHYTTKPGDLEPMWQQVEPNIAIPFHQLIMVSPTEGWAIGRLAEAQFLHYEDGKWQIFSPWGPSNDLAMVSPDEGWGVSNMGSISHYYDGEWHNVIPAARGQENLHTIVMVNPDEGWAAGNSNTLLHYDGQQWQPVPREGRPYFGFLLEMEAVSETEIWAVGDGILHYKDGIWQREPVYDDFGTPALIRGISMINADEGWAVGEGGLIFHYRDNQWQRVDSPTENNLESIDMVSVNEGWAVGSKSTILHYRHATWTLVSETVSPVWMADIAWPDEDTGWGVGADGVWRHINGTWQPIDTPDEFDGAFDVDMVDPEEGWFAGSEMLWHYNQGTWQSYRPGARAIDMINQQEGWAVGANGRILKYEHGQWQEVASPTNASLQAVSMASQQEGWAVGDEGTMLHYQNDVWQVIPPIVEVDLKEVQMFTQSDGATEGWALGERAFLRYQNEVWESVDLPRSNPVLHTMYMFNTNEGWMTSSEGILHYRDGIWETFALPLRASYSAIHMLNKYEGWAVGCCAILHYTNK